MIRKIVITLTLCLSLTHHASAQLTPSQDVVATRNTTEVIDTLKSVFGQFHLAPIVIPQGEKVGDIYNTNNATLIAGPEDCFPGLQVRDSSSQLPAIVLSSETALAAALGVTPIADVDGSANLGRRFTLDFADVKVQRASQATLRRTLNVSAPECKRLSVFIQGETTAKSHRNNVSIVADSPPPLLVGTVFYARRVVHVSLDRKVTADAKISFAQKIMERLGLEDGFKISGDVAFADASSLDLVGKNLVAVALAPAYVVTATKEAGGKVSYTLASIDSQALTSNIQAYNDTRQKIKTMLAELRYLQTFPGQVDSSAYSMQAAANSIVGVPSLNDETTLTAQKDVLRSVLGLGG